MSTHDIIMLAFAVVATIVFIVAGSLYLRRNKRAIDDIYDIQQTLSTHPEEIGRLKERLHFPIAVIDTELTIGHIRQLLATGLSSTEQINIIDISGVIENDIILLVTFRTTKIIPRGRHSIPVWYDEEDPTLVPVIYPGIVRLEKNGPDALQLYSEYPENKDQDFYMQELIQKIKEAVS